MCGIVGAIAQREVMPILMEGLKRLEYRGYDSAGIALRDSGGHLQRIRSVGKVAALQSMLDSANVSGVMGIAHTRWATHGMPAERNAHPHMSGEQVAVVHNGIIENHAELRAELADAGFHFSSETDTEVIAHLLAQQLQAHDNDLLAAVRATVTRLVGAYALAVVSPDEPDRLVVARAGSPLVIGIGVGENFIASDVFALLPVTQQFMFLEEGDLAEIRRESVTVYDSDSRPVERQVQASRRQGPLPSLHAERDLRAAGGDRRDARGAHSQGAAAGAELWPRSAEAPRPDPQCSHHRLPHRDHRHDLDGGRER